MPAANSRLLALTLLATCIATAWGQNANLPDCPCPPTSYRGLQCNPVPCDCATLAVRYGIKAHNDWGSAPGGVRTYWDSQDCNDLVCEQIRTKFGVVPGSSWGSAPANVQDIWLNTNGNCDHGGACVGRGIDCSRCALTYNILPVYTPGVRVPPSWSYGTAPSDAKSAWDSQCFGTACSDCQTLATRYNIVPNDSNSLGKAAAIIQSWYRAAACDKCLSSGK